MKQCVGVVALRELAGGEGKSGDGPIELSLRTDDFQVIEVNNPSGGVIPAPATAKISFVAQGFREVMDGGEPTGIWEFTVRSGEGFGRVWLDAEDILFVKATKRVV